jgi:hypothetical protein
MDDGSQLIVLQASGMPSKHFIGFVTWVWWNKLECLPLNNLKNSDLLGPILFFKTINSCEYSSMICLHITLLYLWLTNMANKLECLSFESPSSLTHSNFLAPVAVFTTFCFIRELWLRPKS